MSKKYENDDYDMEELMPGNQNKKSKRDNILSQLKDIEEDNYTPSGMSANTSFLASSMLTEPKGKKKKKDEYDPDDWFTEMMAFSSAKISSKRSKKYQSDLFESAGLKKKKKKKNKDGQDLVDYKREFEPEMALYKNLLMDQNRFTENLQKEYDALTSAKSSSRGITKTMSELINNITSARQLSMQLVEKNVNAKKLIAELSIKQKKEFGSGSTGDGENMVDFASSYLKQMLNERGNIVGGSNEAIVSEFSEDELLEEISNSIGIDDDDEFVDRSDVDRYLKYENRNVSIYVEITDDDVENYEFVAKDEDGEVIDDYPLPNHTSLSINRSTNIATDIYGKKYVIIWN